MNVTLIGMSGAGKSKLGKLLAEHLGLEFLDVDWHLLEPAHTKSLQDILDELGDQKFMDWEAQMMIDCTKGKDGLLISTPGSAIYEPQAMSHFNDISHIIYLKVPFEVVDKRIGSESAMRGIVGRGRKTLREIYDERVPLYEKYAHFTVPTHEMEAERIVENIVEFLNSRPR